MCFLEQEKMDFKHADLFHSHGGVFEIASRSKHSCFANAIRGISNGKHIWFRAVRDIAAGEEITNDYQCLSLRFPHNRYIRRMISSLTFKFWCDCIACVGNLDICNLRRTLNLDFSEEDKKHFNEHTSETSVIGSCTEEEIARMHEVRGWSIDLDRKINQVLEDLTHLVHALTQNRDLSFGKRKATVRMAIIDQMKTLLKENNKYHLDQYVLKNYAQMKANDAMPGMVVKILAADANYEMF